MKTTSFDNQLRKPDFICSEQRRQTLKADVTHYLENGGKVTVLPPAGSQRCIDLWEIEMLRKYPVKVG